MASEACAVLQGCGLAHAGGTTDIDFHVDGVPWSPRMHGLRHSGTLLRYEVVATGPSWAALGPTQGHSATLLVGIFSPDDRICCFSSSP